MRPSTALVTGCALILALTGCGGGGEDPLVSKSSVPTPIARLALKNFDADCADFLDYAAEGLTEQYLQPFYRCYGDALIACPVYLASETDATSGAPAPSVTPGAAADPGRVSGTNVQEAGVDEADIVKADAAGNLYILSGKSLLVLDAFPPQGLEQRPLASLDLSDGDGDFYASDFFLDEAAQRVVVLAQTYDAGAEAQHVIVDIRDPLAPQIVARLGVSGYALDARRVGARVHRVVRFDVPLPAWFHDAEDPLAAQREAYVKAQGAGDDGAAAAIKTQVREAIGDRLADAGAASLLPVLHAVAGASTLACNDVARPEVAEGLGLAVIDSFDTDGSDRAASAAINNAWLVYGSAGNFYLAQSSFGWRFAPEQAEETAIYRFSLHDTGSAVYEGIGKVPGSVFGAYSFGEYAGHLRVASTETRIGDDVATSYNHLTVLRADVAGGDLPVVGAVRDYAVGERIQGSRFAGARGYVVTFRQIDPLFAFDLADPQDPRIASELKIPGFSTYLAPLGADYLLTVGREGEEDGTLSGRMQVSLFDVSDLDDVRKIADVVPAQPSGYSYSSAEYDPHAFAYFPNSAEAPVPGRLAIPLQSYGEDPDDAFSGFVVIDVDPAASHPLRESGRVDHQAFVEEPSCGGSEAFACGVYGAEPRRAVFAQSADSDETFLYTVSLAGLIASDASNPAVEIARRSLPYEPPYGCCVGVVDSGGP